MAIARPPTSASESATASEGADSRRLAHLPALDGLRGAAAVMVVVFHFFETRPTPAAPVLRAMHQLTHLGQAGIDLFFVLSGYLITRILLHARGGDRPWRAFYARRALRIFPLYYAVLIGLCIATLAGGYGARALQPSWWYWLYLQNVPLTLGRPEWLTFPPIAPIHFWSLAVEEHFYLLWPFVVLRLPRRLLPIVLIGLIALANTLRPAMLSRGFDPYYFTLTRLDGLCIGAFIAAKWETPNLEIRRAAWATILAAIVLLAPIYLSVTGHGLGWVQIAKAPIQAIFFGAILIVVRAAEPREIIHNMLSTKFARSIGRYSYGLYVYHPFVLLATLGLITRQPALAHGGWSLPLLTLNLVGTYAAAWASWHLFEKHFLLLKRRFPYRTRSFDH